MQRDLFGNLTLNMGIRGETWWVDGTNGSDSNVGHSLKEAFQTIAVALAAASPYDTVYVAPGSYSESLDIGSSADPTDKIGLRLIGNPGNTIVPRETRIAAATTHPAITVRSKYVEIAGLTFQTPNQARGTGSPAYYQLSGACIDLINEASVAGTGYYGDAQSTYIHNCAFRVTGSGEVGIMVRAAQMTLIEKCWFRNLDFGVFIGCSYNYNAYFTEVRYCTFKGCKYPIGNTHPSPGLPGAQNTTIGPGNVFGNSNSQGITDGIKLGLSSSKGQVIGNYFAVAKADACDVNKAGTDTATTYFSGNSYTDGVDARS